MERLQNLKDLKSEKLSDRNRKKILSMFHESDMEFDLKNELYRQLEDTQEETIRSKETQAMFDRLWSRISSSNHKHKTFKLNYIYWAAAVLILGFFIGNFFNSSHSEPNEKSVFVSKAPMGSVSETILPDGSTIFLNAGSEIKYISSLGSKIREVYLQGEAWFNVEKSKEIPFIVHTSFYDVRVMGTEFNVKAYPEEKEVITTLEEGSIEIVSTDNLKLSGNIILKPGEQLVFNKTQKSIELSPVRAEVFSAWKDNKLTFINTSLGELAKLLERKYGVEITIHDPGILNYHYDGTIKNETIVEVLNILQSTLPIKYKIEKHKVIIMKN